MARQARMRINRRGRLVITLGVLFAAIALALYWTGEQNTLREVRVVRTGETGSVQYISDEQIIRASGLALGGRIGEISDISKTAQKGIDELGYVSFVSMTRDSRHTVSITVNARKPVAVLDSGGNLLLIDQKGYLMAHLNALPTYDAVYVTGAEITEHREGRKLVARRASQLQDILKIVGAIQASGYAAMYSELNVKDPNGMYLVTSTSLIVKFYTADDMTQTLELAQGIIDKGVTTGKVIISGGYAGYQPPQEADTNAD